MVMITYIKEGCRLISDIIESIISDFNLLPSPMNLFLTYKNQMLN